MTELTIVTFITFNLNRKVDCTVSGSGKESEREGREKEGEEEREGRVGDNYVYVMLLLSRAEECGVSAGHCSITAIASV